jgi:hypothetical protein
MPQSPALDILNELLALERTNFGRRLLESTVFVSSLSVDDQLLVERIARAGDENAAKLTELVLRMGGVPGPRVTDPSVADLHYQELAHVLPRLISDREVLVRKCSLAAQKLVGEPTALAAVQRILARHREELAALQRRGGYNVPASGDTH